MSDANVAPTQKTVVRIGTRGSELATTQAGHVRDALIALGQQAELVVFKTEGDANRKDPVEKIGIGVFTQALRHALREDQCDIVVHSFKDLPTVPEPDLMVAAVPEREDAREVLISRGKVALKDLPEGAKIGTSAPRRVSQLKSLRPDLNIQPLRGNIDTRMNRVNDDLDAVILARAGLSRTGRLDRATETLATDTLMPAPAQGALAVECRKADADIVALLAKINDDATHAHCVAERAVLFELQAGCTAPVAAHAVAVEDGGFELTAGVYALDGSRKLVESARLSASESAATSAVDSVENRYQAAHELGVALARRLKDAGAHEIMGDTLR